MGLLKYVEFWIAVVLVVIGVHVYEANEGAAKYIAFIFTGVSGEFMRSLGAKQALEFIRRKMEV